MVEKQPERCESDGNQLDRIDRNIVALCTAVEDMRKDYSKIIFALIGVVTATLGAKLIGTPWYIDVAIYMTEFASAFLIFHTTSVWKSLHLPQKATRVTGSLLLVVSSITQTIIYHPGVETSPSWFPPVINVLMTLLAFSLIWSAWSYKPQKEAHHACGL